MSGAHRLDAAWLIARRYLWSKRRHPFVGVLSTVSILGVAVGVGALIVVLGVMDGFDQDLKSRLIGMRAHLIVEKEGPFFEQNRVIARFRRDPRVTSASSYVEGQALLQRGEWGAGVMVRGIEAGKGEAAGAFARYLKKGGFSGAPDAIVLGAELAKLAGASVGDEVELLSPNIDKPMKFRIEGLFSSGMFDYDAHFVVMGVPAAQTLFKMDRQVSGVSVFLKDAEKAQDLRRDARQWLRAPFVVRTWIDLNKTLFAALKLEKLVMFLILGLIILVACLNIAGSLTILVMDKTRDLGVLKAIGATPGFLVRVFAFEGLLIGSLGSGAGFAIGGGLCALLKKYPIIQLPPEIYYGIDRLPVSLNPRDVAAVVGLGLVLTFLSALYPAFLAAKLDPVKALRYE